MHVRALLIPILALSFVMPVLAQSDAKYEVSAGYSFLREEFNTNRHGWVTSFNHKIGNQFGIETEVGGNYNKSTSVFGRRLDFVHSILAGPHIKLRNDAKFIPWAHVLVGITVNTVEQPNPILVSPGGLGLAPVRTNNIRFGFQPGGGVDYWLLERFGLRMGVDYRRDIRNFTDTDSFRLQSGIVFRFGQ